MKSYIVFFRMAGSRDIHTAYCQTEMAADTVEQSLKLMPGVAGSITLDIESIITETGRDSAPSLLSSITDRFSKIKQ